MMGAGKSTIGKKLSKNLKLKFIDIDEVIEKKEKKSIKEIFKNKGEDYFRKVEVKTTFEELKRSNLVVALGGGAFIDKSVRKMILNSSISFWLDLDLKTLLSRLKNTKKRPLISQDNLKESINKIYLERKKIYSEANFTIKCNSMDTKEIVNKIINLYENSRN